jgi:hypothetical protein
MSQWGEDINRITSPDNPLSFSNWVEILNFFERHKDDLEIKELEKLVDRCEQCRVYLNKRINDKIKKEDTNPNIYEYLERKIIENNNKKCMQVYQEHQIVGAV